MLRRISALILMIGFVLSCSRRDKLVWISESAKDKPALTDYLSWRTGPSGSLCATNNYSSASGFVYGFSAYSNDIPFPIIAWATDSDRRGKGPIMCTEDGPSLDLPDRESWAEALSKIGSWAGPYQVHTHHGFVELVWANKADESSTRSSMKNWVPPIVLRSRYAADYLKMWHAISGMDFKYDPTVVTRADEYDRKRLLEDSDPDLPMKAETDGWPFPLGFVNFTTSERLAIRDFMPRLAAQVGGLARETRDGWVIDRFQRNEQGLQIIQSCINRMKGVRDDGESIEILSRLGTLALPEVIREFKSRIADGFDPILDNKGLIAILSHISSPERDQVLVSALQNYAAGKREWAEVHLCSIIEALTASHCQTAIPVLEQLAAKKQDYSDVPKAAKIALYAFGRPAPNEGKANVSVARKAKTAINTDIGMQTMKLLRAALIQSGQYEPDMELLSFEKTDAQIALWGRYTRSHSSWTFTIPVLRSDRALVTFGFVCGQLCSAGYRGKLIMQNGRWVIIRWQHTSTS
jgi:hypothetical protein